MSAAAVGLLQVLAILVGAKLGGEGARRLGQPPVLGELLVGVLLGASLLGGWIGMPDLAIGGAAGDVAEHADEVAAGRFFLANHDELAVVEALSILAALGAILLLFEVGLESDLRQLVRVGPSSIAVAILGIVVSFAAGYGASVGLTHLFPAWATANDLLGAHLLHIFVGATMTATSVGITARVLADMGRLRSREARIVLGAAVLDDIGGLLVLAVVAAMVQAALAGGTVSGADVALLAFKAFGFLAVSIGVGVFVVPRAFDWVVERVRLPGSSVGIAFAWAVGMAWLASLAGLADIVGAFVAGVLLAPSKAHKQLEAELKPLAAVLVGFFFVTLGMRVDLRGIGDQLTVVLVAAALLTVIAILAKLSCGFGVTRASGASRLAVGVGMVPRGEVGLIFAALGLSAGLVHNWQYTAIVAVVFLTTFVTPIALARMGHRFRPDAEPPPSGLARVVEA